MTSLVNINPNSFQPVQATGLRILMIDDDPRDIELVRHYMCANTKTEINCSAVQTGSEAVELIMMDQYDCVLLDYNMPHDNGLNVLISLLEVSRNLIPIIMLTGQGNESIAVECLKMGAADYLRKGDLSEESINRTVHNAVEKQKLRNAIDKQNRTLRENHQELLKKHREIERFYQSVSHELKTPLTAIKQYTCLFLDDICGPVNIEQREYLTIIDECCNQIKTSLNDLLDITTLETGKYTLNKKVCAIPNVVEAACASMKTIAAERSITLNIHCMHDVPEIEIDPIRITQVMHNLIGNAIKFSPAGSEIDIAIAHSEPTADFVTIAVKDSGCGINSKYHNCVFDRLYQVRSSSADESIEYDSHGLGLGLAISKEIIALHGGSIGLESASGVGSTFTVSIPTIRNKLQGVSA